MTESSSIMFGEDQEVASVISIPLEEIMATSGKILKTHPFLGVYKEYWDRVYIVTFPDDLVKIGLSKFIGQRVKAIVTQHRSAGIAAPIGRVAATIAHINARENEHLMHRLWAMSSAHGEYFNVSYEEALNSLRSLTFRMNFTPEEQRQNARNDAAFAGLQRFILGNDTKKRAPPGRPPFSHVRHEPG